MFILCLCRQSKEYEIAFMTEPYLPCFSDSHKDRAALWCNEARNLLAPDPPLNAEDITLLLAPVLFASSFLHLQARHHASDIPALFAGNIDEVLFDAHADWRTSLSQSQTNAGHEQALRVWRNRSHFAIALAELWGHDNIAKSYKRLTHIAEQAVKGCVERLIAEPVDGCGWVILALGKLGAGELNFSSDIDLIMLHDSQHPQHDDTHFIDRTRTLSQLLSRQTSDGFGWRVDLRLRPDMGGGAVSLGIKSALKYYETNARSWERAAFIRARPIAGDLALGKKFLANIAPFIWRRSLDFTVIDDLHLWLQHLPVPNELFGIDVKKGAFGIRHIELLAHTIQLLKGGRQPDLRIGNTIGALLQCAESGWIETDKAEMLSQNYLAWRRIEHRLQYQKDTQTYALPRNEEEFNKFAGFMGFSNASFLRSLIDGLITSTEHAADHQILNYMLQRKKQQREQFQQLSLPKTADKLIDWLLELGYERPVDMAKIIEKWLNGGVPATRGERARSYLEELLSELMPRLSSADEPDAAFAGFAYLVDGLSSGAQFFALLFQNPPLCDLLCNIMIKAPRLAGALCRAPVLLDRVLDPDFFMPLQLPDQLHNNLKERLVGLDNEQVLEHLSVWLEEQRFTCEVQALEGRIAYDEFGFHYSNIADIVIQEICQLAAKDFGKRYGYIDGSSYSIIGIGQLGSRMMTVHSDLDLIFVYDGDQEALSDGTRKVGLATYYIKLSQLITSWLSVETSRGRLFEIDLRLRPDGKAGPIAVHTARLYTYYQKEAWPWEHLAFLKARPVVTLGDCKKNIASTLKSLHHFFPSIESLRTNLIDMRIRLASSTPSALNIKKRSGGLLDLEFLIYFAGHQGGFIKENINKNALTLPRLLECLAEIVPHSSHIASIYARLMNIRFYLKLCLPANQDQYEIPEKQADIIARLAGYGDLTALKKQLNIDCAFIEGCLKQHLEIK